LAHHAGDQAETILMRFAKGSGIDGLAGMSAVTEVDGVRLARPLLGEPKARLIATCEAHHIVYVTDPSNEADKYARGRLRRVLPLLESEGFTSERLLDLGDRAREAKEALDHYAHGFLQEAVHAMEGGAFRLELSTLRGLPRAVALRALVMLLMALHEESYPPERKHLIPVLDWLLDQDEGEARTLNGVLVQKGDLCDRAIFLREPAAITDRQSLIAGQTCVWDARWDVTYGGLETGLEIRALGLQPHDVLDHFAPQLRAHIPQGRVRAGLPAVWRDDELVAIPSFAEQDQGVAKALRRPVLWE
ncbi:MAG: ATP-binding protein, partial [Alphaproteobacteria bacterium]|nr:ATP-binding protein [Alphaproteobacteria bacterium]